MANWGKREKAAGRSGRGLAALLLVSLLAGCASNQFRLAATPRDQGSPGLDGPPRQTQPIWVPPDPAAHAPPAPVQPIQEGVGPVASTIPSTPDDWPQRLHENPNPRQTGARNRPRWTETPRPGEPGSRLVAASEVAELTGRVVDPVGQPLGSVPIQVRDLGQGGRIAAEIASLPDGRFRVRNLRPGSQYELVASSTRGTWMTGSAIVSPPHSSIVIQLRRRS